ncbi:RsmF rRNA methyltransferase first C-terminal domain-containing protein [Eubacteriaceae bacterium ES3]|nr:RsmF rRNA methyltransferase first C-terminal domain-containing protein [Eubacteriaceae bacterium ES3]
MELPQAFKEKMKELMGPEYEAFLETYDREEIKGLRTNTLKIAPEQLKRILPFETNRVPWCETGFFIDASVRPGKNPFYYAGLYYVQEPTAMAAVEALDVSPGDWVLDLCAAPGGKSTQIGAALQGEGLLVANELVNSRAGVLSTNIERMGIGNVLVTNEFPERLVSVFYEKFDKILVDAPCSGEGMFRKDPGALNDWSIERVERCVGKQEKILESASRLLKPEGILVYSTCTFSPEENEQVIEDFLNQESFSLERISLTGLNDSGHPEWSKNNLKELDKTLRIMPMHVQGEGHFIARLKKEKASQEHESGLKASPKGRFKKAAKQDLKNYQVFLSEMIRPEYQVSFSKNLYQSGDHLYQFPQGISADSISGLKVLRPGLHLGQLKKNRFEPSYALAMFLTEEMVLNSFNLSSEEMSYQYLKGEIIEEDQKSGWVLLTYQGYPLGFGKASEKKIKNHYPKGLRIRKK